MTALRDMDVTVLRPDGFEWPQSVMERAAQLAAESGGSLRESSDRSDALSGPQVVHVREWSSTRHYGDTLAETKLRNTLTDWCIDDSWFKAPELGGICAIFEQDTANMPLVHRGMKAGGRRLLGKPGVTLANYQEIRIRHYHMMLDKYLAG